MDNRTLMMLRVFVNRYNPLAGNALLKFLPPETMQAVLSQDIRSNDLTPLLDQPHALLNNLHYSWIKPVLLQFSAPLQPLLIAALNPDQMMALKDSQKEIELSPPVKNFFLNLIFDALKTDDHVPLEYLPITDFTPLTKWSKAQLVNLADYLGIHDLASEVRHIVNKDHLRNIYSCLTPHQYKYLSQCLHQKEKIVAPKLGIDPAVKDCSKLKQIIHRRGLLRLAKALSGQHPDLVWYLAHTFDTGRGKLLLITFQTEVDPKVTALLKSQVINLMNFLKVG